MKFKSFINAFLPEVGKENIADEIGEITDDLRRHTLPAYKQSVELSKKFKYKGSTEMSKMHSQFGRIYKEDNIVVYMAAFLERLSDNIDVAEAAFSESFEDDVVKEALTYKRIGILQHIELSSFVVRFSRRLLMYIYAVETEQLKGARLDRFYAGEGKYLLANFTHFTNAIESLGVGAEVTQGRFEQMPDIIVKEDNIETQTSLVGINKLDPFKFNLIAPNWNPIFYIRMPLADRRVAKMREAQEEAKALQHRILHYKELQDGKNDPALSERIEYMEERVVKLRNKVERYEKGLRG